MVLLPATSLQLLRLLPLPRRARRWCCFRLHRCCVYCLLFRRAAADARRDGRWQAGAADVLRASVATGVYRRLKPEPSSELCHRWSGREPPGCVLQGPPRCRLRGVDVRPAGPTRPMGSRRNPADRSSAPVTRPSSLRLVGPFAATAPGLDTPNHATAGLKMALPGVRLVGPSPPPLSTSTPQIMQPQGSVAARQLGSSQTNRQRTKRS